MLLAFSLKDPGFSSVVLKKLNHLALLFLSAGGNNAKVFTGAAGIVLLETLVIG